jgi:drug/metabolite transporter (DMT)-like permease
VPLFLWRRPQEKPFARSDVPVLLSLGVLGMAANQVFFVFGMSRTSVAHSSLVIGLTPMLVLMLAAAVGQERLTGRKLAGMAIAIGGILALNASKAGPATPLGDLLIFGSGAAFAVFTVFGKKVAKRHTSLTVNTFAYAGGAFMLLPATLWYAPRFAFDRVPFEGWAAIVYMALFPSLVCYLIYYYALTHIPASRVSAFSYLQPLLATAAAALTLGERVTGNVIGGGLLVLTGVWLTERG